MPKVKNIFLDRDGTIIKEKHYLSNPQEVEFISGAKETLLEMKKRGLKLFIITNQSGIGRNYFSLEDFYKVQKRLDSLLGEEIFTHTAFCPHTPEDNCNCRKPKTGLFAALKERYHLNPEECVVIGDKVSDILWGKNLNFALSCLVLTGHGPKEITRLNLKLPWQPLHYQKAETDFPLLIARDLKAAWQGIKDLDYV